MMRFTIIYIALSFAACTLEQRESTLSKFKTATGLHKEVDQEQARGKPEEKPNQPKPGAGSGPAGVFCRTEKPTSIVVTDTSSNPSVISLTDGDEEKQTQLAKDIYFGRLSVEEAKSRGFMGVKCKSSQKECGAVPSEYTPHHSGGSNFVKPEECSAPCPAGREQCAGSKLCECNVYTLTCNTDTGKWDVSSARLRECTEGCIKQDSLITLFDGSQKSAKAVQSGDKLLNPFQPKIPAIVKEVVAGPEEKEILIIKTKTKKVEVTESHPMFAKKGLVKASELKVGSELKVAENKFEKVESVTKAKIKSSEFVYNFKFDTQSNEDAAHAFFANGVATGNIHLQLKLKGKK